MINFVNIYIFFRSKCNPSFFSASSTLDANVGFVGLGIMGTGMATNLVTKGHNVTVYDVDSKAVDNLVSKGNIKKEAFLSFKM